MGKPSLKLFCVSSTSFDEESDFEGKNIIPGAQQELSLSHKFTENQFINHRIMITGILEKLTKFSIDRYLDAIDVVKRVAAETREQMMTYESSPCTTNARDRWERQVLSHVNRVNYCIQEATRILIGEYYDLWYFDKDGARVSNHVQNQGVNIMTQNDVMDSNNDFYTLINRRLRDLLLRAGRKSDIKHDRN